MGRPCESSPRYNMVLTVAILKFPGGGNLISCPFATNGIISEVKHGGNEGWDQCRGIYQHVALQSILD